MKGFKRRPTSEEVINGIVSIFTPEELEAFRVDFGDGESYDLKQQMEIYCTGRKPSYSVEESKKKVIELIDSFRPKILIKDSARELTLSYIKGNIFAG